MRMAQSSDFKDAAGSGSYRTSSGGFGALEQVYSFDECENWGWMTMRDVSWSDVYYILHVNSGHFGGRF